MKALSPDRRTLAALYNLWRQFRAPRVWGIDGTWMAHGGGQAGSFFSVMGPFSTKESQKLLSHSFNNGLEMKLLSLGNLSVPSSEGA